MEGTVQWQVGVTVIVILGPVHIDMSLFQILTHKKQMHLALFTKGNETSLWQCLGPSETPLEVI